MPKTTVKKLVASKTTVKKLVAAPVPESTAEPKKVKKIQIPKFKELRELKAWLMKLSAEDRLSIKESIDKTVSELTG